MAPTYPTARRRWATARRALPRLQARHQRVGFPLGAAALRVFALRNIAVAARRASVGGIG